LQGPVISNAQTALFTATLAQSDTQSENAREHGTGPKPGEIEIKSEASNSSAGETLQASHAPTAVVDSSKVTKEVPKFATVTADDRVNNAIAFLNSGEEQQAEQELADALVIEPGNRSARKLMRQLHESPDSFFEEEEYFEYRLRSNETLISVAEKFLKDPLDFYMLAKLNDIDYPNSITPGKVLMIPGQNDFSDEIPVAPLPDVPREDPSNISEPPAESVKTEADIKIERAKVYYAEHRFREAINLIQPYANQKPVARYAPLKELLAQCYLELADELGKKGNLLEAQATLESSLNILPDNKSLNAQLTVVKNQREAERLYHLALQESKSGKESQALNDLAKALQLNPDHTQAKKQMIDLRLTVVEEYHKQAMVLYRKQELSRAIEKWDDVLRLDPNHELAKKYRARALELQRKIEQL
jgi:tetratricopeptide (TPR) repeat protein